MQWVRDRLQEQLLSDPNDKLDALNLLRYMATASVALLLPDTVFSVGDEPDACRLSDDFWISHFFHRANISLEGLPRCRLGSVLRK